MRGSWVHRSPPRSTGWWARPKLTVLLPLLLLSLGLGVAVVYGAQVTRPISGGVAINLVEVESFADVDRNGVVDSQDLSSIVGSLNTRPESDVALDMNQDGVVDLLDLVFAAMNFGRRF